MPDYPVKYFDQATFAAPPRLSGTPGDMIALLDACLINGFNVLPVQSLVVSNNIATATFANPHGYIVGQIIRIEGAAPTGLNGEHLVVSVSSNALTFTDSPMPNVTATGVIGCRTAPVDGWQKVFSGTNLAAYRSTDPAGNCLFLRIDDTGTLSSRVVGYESMSDVSFGTGMFPTAAQQSGGWHWQKSTTANTTARRWVLVADARGIIINVADGTAAATNTFMEFVSEKAGDAFNTLVSGGTSAGFTASVLGRVDGGNVFAYAARSFSQLGGSVILQMRGVGNQGNMGQDGFTFPCPVTSGLIFNRTVFIQEGTSALRGTLSGVVQPMQNQPLSHGDIVSNIPNLPGRRLLMLQNNTPFGQGRVAIDITGPWRG